MEVHKDSITIVITEQGRNGEVRIYGEISDTLNQIDKLVRKLTSKNAQLRCIYEAGPCGHILYRHLTNKGIDRAVVAPALILKKVETGSKTTAEMPRSWLPCTVLVNSLRFMFLIKKMKPFETWSVPAPTCGQPFAKSSNKSMPVCYGTESVTREKPGETLPAS